MDFYSFPEWVSQTILVMQRTTNLAAFVRSPGGLWIWPMAETIHFMGLSLLIGAIGILDLRLIGVGRGLSIAHVKKLVPWGVLGFAMCVVTGIMFLIGNLDTNQVYLTNPAFKWKVVFLGLAGINVALFELTGLSRKVNGLAPDAPTPVAARLTGAASLMLWIGVIVWGRFLPTLGDAF